MVEQQDFDRRQNLLSTDATSCKQEICVGCCLVHLQVHHPNTATCAAALRRAVTRKKSAGLKCCGHGMWQRSKCFTCSQAHSLIIPLTSSYYVSYFTSNVAVSS